jgi:histidine triad (HIT) family protein
MSDCLFCKIIDGSIDAQRVYEDEHVLAFNDINPQAPLHVLIIPKKHIATTNDIVPNDVEVIGLMSLVAAKIAQQKGVADKGYRTVINCGEGAGQTVFHLHMHVLAGRSLAWPPG